MDSRSAELFAAAALEFSLGQTPRFYDRCPQHNRFHRPGTHNSRPDLTVGTRLIDVGIVTQPRLQQSIKAAAKKIGTARWEGRYTWRVHVPLQDGPEGQERYPRTDKLTQRCLNTIRMLEACMSHPPTADGSCPEGNGFLCYLVHTDSPLHPRGFWLDRWMFRAEEDTAGAKQVEMLATWAKNSPLSLFLDTIRTIVNGDDTKPSDIKKKMDTHRTPETTDREVFFVPALDFLTSARMDILTHNFTPRSMKRYVTGIYVSAPSFGGVAHWTRRGTRGTWDFKPFPEDFTGTFLCPED